VLVVTQGRKRGNGNASQTEGFGDASGGEGWVWGDFNWTELTNRVIIGMGGLTRTTW
jgi:hypothetical protein